MPRNTYAEARDKMEKRSKALAVNREELPQLELSRIHLEEVLAELRNLTTQQASLTAAKQEVSKRIAERTRVGKSLMNLLDIGVKSHYGNRAEKLVEFGLQPFRSEPRVRLVDLAGNPVKRKKKGAVEPAAPAPVTEP